jgi:hypothetical protein
MTEQILYRGTAIDITTAKLEIYGKMYSIAHITSIESTQKNPDTSKANSIYWTGIFLTICSVFGALGHTDGILNSLGNTILFNLLIATPMIAISDFYRNRQKTTYCINFKTTSGETENLTTNDEQTFKSIQGALKNAIIFQNSTSNIQPMKVELEKMLTL